MATKFISKSFSALAVFLFLSSSAWAASEKTSEKALLQVLNNLKKSGRISAQIVNLTNTRDMIAVDENQPLNPASSIKLFTTYTALKRLGINYQFSTQIFRSGNDNLCVKGGGDPSFVMEDLYLLVQTLKRRGLTHYSGKITLDATVFDSELIPEDRTDQDSERAYNAPIAGLNFNYNTISVFVDPTKKGEPATISLDWPFPFVKVQGKVMTASSTDVTWDKKSLGKADAKTEDEIVHLGGKIAEDGDEWRKPFRLRNPSRGFGLALAKMLNDQGVTTAAAAPTINEGTCSGEPFYTYTSKPLSFIVQLMNKYSNNFIADSLVKILDHEVNGHAGTATGGLSFISDTLKTIGIDSNTKGRHFDSGSGLTRGNAFAASDFIKLMKHIHQEKLFLPEIFASLPIAGVDGTLKKKYQRSGVSEKLRGKTGTLNNVQSLVGIYPNSKGEWIAIAIIVNSGHSIPEIELARYLESL